MPVEGAPKEAVQVGEFVGEEEAKTVGAPTPAKSGIGVVGPFVKAGEADECAWALGSNEVPIDADASGPSSAFK